MATICSFSCETKLGKRVAGVGLGHWLPRLQSNQLCKLLKVDLARLLAVHDTHLRAKVLPDANSIKLTIACM